jgi:hypothetical protein
VPASRTDERLKVPAALLRPPRTTRHLRSLSSGSSRRVGSRNERVRWWSNRTHPYGGASTGPAGPRAGNPGAGRARSRGRGSCPHTQATLALAVAPEGTRLAFRPTLVSSDRLLISLRLFLARRTSRALLRIRVWDLLVDGALDSIGRSRPRAEGAESANAAAARLGHPPGQWPSLAYLLGRHLFPGRAAPWLDGWRKLGLDRTRRAQVIESLLGFLGLKRVATM